MLAACGGDIALGQFSTLGPSLYSIEKKSFENSSRPTLKVEKYTS